MRRSMRGQCLAIGEERLAETSLEADIVASQTPANGLRMKVASERDRPPDERIIDAAEATQMLE